MQIPITTSPQLGFNFPLNATEESRSSENPLFGEIVKSFESV